MKERDRIHAELIKQKNVTGKSNGTVYVSDLINTDPSYSQQKPCLLNDSKDKSSSLSTSQFINMIISEKSHGADLPNPSSKQSKWWESGHDVSKIPWEGTEKNPFYDLDKGEIPASTEERPQLPPPLPSRSSKSVSIKPPVNLMD